MVHTKLTWSQAQVYCRLHGKDLASVRSQADNQAVQQMLTGHKSSPSSFWIGLFKDQWKWSDQSNSSFRYWEESQPNEDGDCVLYNSLNNKWYDRGCTNSFPYFCYYGEQHAQYKSLLRRQRWICNHHIVLKCHC